MIINMQSGGVVPERIIDAQTITPSTENQVIEEETFLRGALTILGDSDLLPGNIVNGKNIFGVEGSYNPATADPDLIPDNIRDGVDIFGVIGTMTEGAAGIDFGEVTITGYTQSITVSHKLGVIPKNVFLIPKGSFTINTSYMETYAIMNDSSFASAYISGHSAGGFKKFGSTNTKTATSVTFKPEYEFVYNSFYWVAIA